MKQRLLLFYLFILLIPGSCTVSRESLDRKRVSYLGRNTGLVREAVEHVLSASLQQKENNFTADRFTDKEMRRKIESLGWQVTVFYRNTLNAAGSDSLVVFKSITPLGTTEVIYDFAAAQRSFPEKKERPKEFYFVKVTDRIYYVRRATGLM